MTITTIQRLYSILRGEAELDPELDEHSAYDLLARRAGAGRLQPGVPIETFDVVIVDECHRSIYGVWRQVLDYFDAFLVGLTATPNKQTFGFFNQNLVMEYTHEQAVADGSTSTSTSTGSAPRSREQGSTVEAGLVTDFRDRQTRAAPLGEARRRRRLRRAGARPRGRRQGPDPHGHPHLQGAPLHRDLPGPHEVPKTLIFAKDDSHADDIVQIVREEFGKGDDFAVKITYKTTGRKPDDLLAEFRNCYNPRIAVTVDMIATGTDVKPLECVFFMRTVKSRTFFEQMKGRGVRVINEADLQAVTPDAKAKTRFVIVDAVGVTETDLNDTQPLERKPTVPLEKPAASRSRSAAATPTSSPRRGAPRPARPPADEEDREELEELAGTDLATSRARSSRPLDPDRQLEAAQEATGKDEPTRGRVAAAAKQLLDAAVEPLATNPELRERLVELRRSYEQMIDEFSQDEVIEAGYSLDGDRPRAADRRVVPSSSSRSTRTRSPRSRCSTAGRTGSGSPSSRSRSSRTRSGGRRTLDAREALAGLRGARALEGARLGGRVLTDMVSLVRFALEQDDELVPYPELVDERFQAWLLAQENAGRTFTPEQLAWLERIRDHVAASLAITATTSTTRRSSSTAGSARRTSCSATS